jgi:hypothetical protein
MRITSKVTAASLIGAALLVAGCGGGSSGTVADDHHGDSQVPVTVVPIDQSGVLAPQPGAPQPKSAWQTTEAMKLINPVSMVADVDLIAQLDSSGADAWDPTKHPLVFVTTNGPGYGGLLAKDWDPVLRQFRTNASPNAQKWQGLAMFDAATKEAVASAAYPDIGPNPQATVGASENHGLGISQDGKWIYTEGNDSRSTYANKDVLNVINARTLKVDKIINSRAHHARTFKDAATGKDLVLIDAWNNQFYAMDPSDNHKIVKAVSPADLNGAGYLAFVDYSGKWLFITTRDGFPGSDGGIAVVDLKTMKVSTRIAIDDTSPIWVTFSANGKFAYVSGGHGSMIAKIDISDPNPGVWKYVARSNAGVEGPYGLSMNWQDTIVFSTGKNEGASNKGMEAGIAPVAKFGDPAAASNGGVLAPLYLNGCIRPDHSVVNPDKAANELWFTCNSSFENVVIDMGDGTGADWQSFKVKKFNVSATNPNGNVLQPNGGSSHGGAFAKYTVSGTNWTGELLSDTNGFHGSAIATYKAAAAAAGN